ncbi:DUF3817 domain-containing protein [Mumia sp. zg.B53]|uniref:DUF3817 domain-containing protein n=1 Tax=unclassified Mumia TaxID=2621872 RepID=UPI001C6DF7FB|nr:MULTISPECIES: DUF3817 domain-containing protein [unclassified Mumia]MBW9207703.1 DUF3817 domain-containing protein [Mumia sp. zg.B17]MBW9209951.1 DUF3817 domain-containing protein [Mumia sp. zg.B21]MBW9214555.1 DUF3817 domain-containing protein [Mumia sp. zg.B53]MDD9347676.1 DUF3817 domain-containing protein [Mumia sp.]
MPKTLAAYRVLALVVSFFVIAVVGGWIIKMVSAEGSTWHDIGEFTASISPIHGVFYMVLLVITAVLSRQAGWSVGFTVTTMVLATIPFVSFWAEHRATRHTKELWASYEAEAEAAAAQ